MNFENNLQNMTEKDTIENEEQIPDDELSFILDEIDDVNEELDELLVEE